MDVRNKDWAPPFLLDRRPLTVAEWIGGLATIGAAVVAPAIILAATGAVSAALVEGDEVPFIEPEEVIAARFVQLGRDFQDELPNRVVPQAAMAPPDSVAISENPDDVQREPDERERPENALERDLSNLLDRVDPFAEEAEAYEREGSPDGIEEGTETEATAGNIYAGQLYRMFRRGWTVPTTISDEARRGLTVSVQIEVSESLQIVRSRVVNSSGNPDFDQSVIAQIERLKANNVAIPEPPLADRPNYVPGFGLRFRGRDARSE